jgi:hypothetical protein
MAMIFHILVGHDSSEALVTSDAVTHPQCLHLIWIPSGKHTKNYGKSPSLIGKSTINGQFSIATLNYQRIPEGKFTSQPDF